MVHYKNHPKYRNVYYRRHPKQFLTENLDRGRSVYGEKLKHSGNMELRVWDPHRSKLGAALHQNARSTFIRPTSRVLYLGASSGTTVSHISDIVVDGIVYAVEFSPRSIRELVQNCTDRSNVVPILEDANQPQRFSKFVSGEIDVVYQDVAQPNQTEILLKNAKYYLKNGGHVIFCIKARSIDSTEKPSVIFNEQKDILKENGFNILDNVSIHRFQTDHRVIFAQK